LLVRRAYAARKATLMRLVQGLLYAVQSLLVPLCCSLAAYRLVALRVLPSYLAATRAAAASSAQHAHTLAASAAASLSTAGEDGGAVALPGPVQGALGALAGWIEAHAMPAALEFSAYAAGAAPATAVEEEATPSAPLWPAVATFGLAFVVARSLASVYECAVETVFVCAMHDHDAFDSSFMSGELREALELAPARDSRRDDAGRERKGAAPLI
jgi:hypothetical protein